MGPFKINVGGRFAPEKEGASRFLFWSGHFLGCPLLLFAFSIVAVREAQTFGSEGEGSGFRDPRKIRNVREHFFDDPEVV